MKRFAYNELILEDGKIISPAVVEMTEDGIYAWHYLNKELPMTEWKGGTAMIKNGKLIIKK